MSQLVQISDLSKRYTPNLFRDKSLLSDSTTISFSQISVGGGYELSEVDSYTGVGSAFRVGLVQNVDTGFQTIFSFGDALTTTVNEQGNYLFQMSLKVVLNNGLNLIDLIVTPFINSAPQKPFTITLNVGEMPNNKYVTFSQNINLNVDDEVDFSFEFAKDSVGTPNPNATICIDGFKLEKDTYEVGGSGIPSIYTLPTNYNLTSNSIFISETQWDVVDVGSNVVANGDSLNLFTLIDNSTDKNLTNSDTYDQLDIVSDAIKTTYRNGKIIHNIRIDLNISAGSDQHYQLQIRRKIDDSVVYRALMQRNADETIQTIEMTTRTLSEIDPFVVDGFYLAFVNNSGSSATISGTLSMVVISNYQKAQ